MSKIKFKPLIKTIRSGLAKHSPAILTALGITGMIGTTVLAVKATPKALDLIENKKEELDKDELTKAIQDLKAENKQYIVAGIRNEIIDVADRTIRIDRALWSEG